MNKMTKNFNPIDTELLTGINLIEASAGTGKTYAIAMLVLRFVVEQKLDIKTMLFRNQVEVVFMSFLACS